MASLQLEAEQAMRSTPLMRDWSPQALYHTTLQSLPDQEQKPTLK